MSEVDVSDQTRLSIQVTVNGESWGDIQLKFYPDVAPNHGEKHGYTGQRQVL